MEPCFSASWVHKGAFDLSEQDPRDNVTQRIKQLLCRSLRLKKDGLSIHHWPAAPGSWSHICWWREGTAEYAEAQFFAQISDTHPVLSLGVAVEKGLGARWKNPKQVMRGAKWDWRRLMKHLPTVLSTDVVAASKGLGPINVRIRSRRKTGDDRGGAWATSAFSLVDGTWFDRATGRRTTAEAIGNDIEVLDGKPDHWGIVHFARDFGPQEADGMTAEAAASVLLAFAPIRRRLRP